MHPQNCNSLSALVYLVHGKQNDLDCWRDCCLSRACHQQFLSGTCGQHACQCLSLYVIVAVFELTGSFPLTVMVNRNVFARISGNREQWREAFWLLLEPLRKKKM